MGAFASSFSSAFVREVAVYIAPMRGQRALFEGAAESYANGVLKIGGKVLIGLSGRPYAFVSAGTAARWCVAGRRVIEAELAVVERLGDDTRAAWLARKQDNLDKRAAAILDRVPKQPDAAKRAALIEEATLCETKWAAYG